MGFYTTTSVTEKPHPETPSCAQKTASGKFFTYPIKTQYKNRHNSLKTNQEKPLPTHETASGVFYYKFRHYSAELGRWPARDPIEERGGVNLYAFVGNDGINLWDELGLAEEDYQTETPKYPKKPCDCASKEQWKKFHKQTMSIFEELKSEVKKGKATNQMKQNWERARKAYLLERALNPNINLPVNPDGTPSYQHPNGGKVRGAVSAAQAFHVLNGLYQDYKTVSSEGPRQIAKRIAKEQKGCCVCVIIGWYYEQIPDLSVEHYRQRTGRLTVNNQISSEGPYIIKGGCDEFARSHESKMFMGPEFLIGRDSASKRQILYYEENCK